MNLDELVASIDFDAKLVRDDFTINAPKLDLSGMSHWLVTIICNGHSHSSDYGYGAAYRHYTRPGGHPGKPVQFSWNGRYTIHEYSELARSTPDVPDVRDVLYCLFIDAESVFHNDFDEWCERSCCSNDSIKAKETYDACCRTWTAMNRMFDLEQLTELFENY